MFATKTFFLNCGRWTQVLLETLLNIFLFKKSRFFCCNISHVVLVLWSLCYKRRCTSRLSALPDPVGLIIHWGDLSSNSSVEFSFCFHTCRNGLEKYIKLVLPLPFRNISCVKKKNPLNTSIFKMSHQTEDDNVEIVNPIVYN